jgi:hypothetical protein
MTASLVLLILLVVMMMMMVVVVVVVVMMMRLLHHHDGLANDMTRYGAHVAHRAMNHPGWLLHHDDPIMVMVVMVMVMVMMMLLGNLLILRQHQTPATIGRL